jgi:hypothetical protein
MPNAIGGSRNSQIQGNTRVSVLGQPSVASRRALEDGEHDAEYGEWGEDIDSGDLE